MWRMGSYVFVLALSTIQFETSAVAEPGSLPGRDHSKDSRARFRKTMPLTVRGDHPAIQPVVAAILAVTTDPLEQIVMVNDVTHLLVDYDEDHRVYGQPEYHATLDEMIARRRETGWVYLRDDCDGRAVFAAHLLAALGIPWRFEASYWQRHAWIVAHVDGADYDLLGLHRSAPEQQRLSYRLIGHRFVRPAQLPPYFRWRRAWQERTAQNIAIGKQLGLLELDSTDRRLHERVATDWTKVRAGGDTSPFDQRMISASFAAFPFGDALRPESFAGIAVQAAYHSDPNASMNGPTESTDSRP